MTLPISSDATPTAATVGDAHGVLIQPNDPVFFRDGKPFTMGEEVHTTGLFPPLPSVLQGALRSVYFAQHPDEIPIRKKDDQEDKTAEIRFANALLCHDRALLFPWPADLLLVKGAILPLKPTKREKSKFLSSQGDEFPYFLEPKTPNAAKVESSAHSYLTHEGMEKYLSGQEIQPRHRLNLKEQGLLHEESRIGIGRTPYGVTEEGQLYRMTRLRMQDGLQFYVTHDGLSIPEEGTLALGSEGVSAHYASTGLPLALPGCALSFSPNAVYKLYVMSPAVVETGQPYLPPCLQAEDVQVLTFATGRPVAVGGWDMKANEPKPMRNAIPAGAVYYFTVADAPTFEKIKATHGQSVCAGEYQRQGFGIVLLGIHRARLFLLFSHELTEAQRDDARESMGVGAEDITRLPEDLQQQFSNVPPELDSIETWVQPLKDWLGQTAKPGDYVLVQGDFGLVVNLVAFCQEQGLRPLYATTARQVVMEGDGKKTSIFKHTRYRFY